MRSGRYVLTLWGYLLPPLPQHMMEAAHSAETLLPIHQATQHHNPQNNISLNTLWTGDADLRF